MPKLAGSLSRSGIGSSPGKRTLIALVCVSVLLVTLYAREGSSGPVHLLRSAVQVVATPFNYAGAYLAGPLDTVGTALTDASASPETLTALKERNASLMSQLAELEEYRVENERLRDMLSMSGAYGTQGVGARVIGGAVGDWEDTVTIDKGFSTGVEVGMPVTDGNGVVGQVSAVSAFSSTVTLLSDPGSGVSALLQGSRVTGVLAGSVDGSVHLEYIPVSTPVNPGELVVTSGMGGVYPKGMLLGSVASVTSSPSDVYYSIVVTPVATASNLEEVYVVTSYEPARAEMAAETLLLNGTLETHATDGGGQ